MAKKKQKTSTSAKKKRITVSFTWSGLFSTAVLVVLSIIWAFILGILVGRGYSPETLFPKLASLLPAAESATEKTPESSHSGEVLKPEELGFYETLGHNDGGRPAGSSTDSSRDAGSTGQEPKSAGSSVSSATTRQENAAPGYRYVYQVAAFKSAEKAFALQDRLRAKGIRSEVSAVHIEERKWYRIVASFEGRPADTEGFKTELKRLGLHQPLLRSKKRLGGE